MILKKRCSSSRFPAETLAATRTRRCFDHKAPKDVPHLAAEALRTAVWIPCVEVLIPFPCQTTGAPIIKGHLFPLPAHRNTDMIAFAGRTRHRRSDVQKHNHHLAQFHLKSHLGSRQPLRRLNIRDRASRRPLNACVSSAPRRRAALYESIRDCGLGAHFIGWQLATAKLGTPMLQFIFVSPRR